MIVTVFNCTLANGDSGQKNRLLLRLIILSYSHYYINIQLYDCCDLCVHQNSKLTMPHQKFRIYYHKTGLSHKMDYLWVFTSLISSDSELFDRFLGSFFSASSVFFRFPISSGFLFFVCFNFPKMDFLFKASRWCRSSSSPLLSCLKLNSAHSLGVFKTKIQTEEKYFKQLN